MDAAEQHTVGSKVWCSDDSETWIKGEVIRVENGGATLVVKTEGGKEVSAKPEQLPLQNPDSRGVEVRILSQSVVGCTWEVAVCECAALLTDGKEKLGRTCVASCRFAYQLSMVLPRSMSTDTRRPSILRPSVVLYASFMSFLSSNSMNA